MASHSADAPASGHAGPRALYVYNAGFVRQRRLARILELAGYRLRFGRPGSGDFVGIWGESPTASRGKWMSARYAAPLVRIEDAWLRSVRPGRTGSAPLGLLIDHRGAHFDPRQPSDLEVLLRDHPLDDTALLDRARACTDQIQEAHMSKYTGFDPDAPVPAPGYVLIIDQTEGDAAVRASGADRNRFLEMLFVAQEEHPGAHIVIKTHPETAQGHRQGHFRTGDGGPNAEMLDRAVSPWALFKGAIAVYTVSSTMGFEAIFAGHKPRVFGHPFYAGWGLTADEMPLARRQRALTRAQIFAAAMLLYPTWYDPYHDRLCSAEEAAIALEAQTRAWRADHQGWTASGMRLWKRRHIARFFSTEQRVVFRDRPTAQDLGRRPHMVWANRDNLIPADRPVTRVEDGFLRSKGLGAALVPPMSLVTDTRGIYYDPSRPNDLEHWIEKRATLRPDQHARAARLIADLRAAGLSKYNLDGATPDLPEGKLVLVVGQVEDDASIRLGTDGVATNAALLHAARAANPDAALIYKPHPDVEAGLRPGAITGADADVIAHETDIAALLEQVDALWTMTSLAGFEALIRGVPVTTLGAPFYAGWGLTRDIGAPPAQRRARPSLEGLVHATLIDYPRYRDPKTGLACPVEVIVARLRTDAVARSGLGYRSLAKAHGLLASFAPFWR